MPLRWIPVACLVVVASLAPAAASNAQPASFDGTWSVVQACESTQEGARPYTWRYDATVKGGHLVGQYGIKGQSSSVTLEGDVKPDGTATLVAEGLTGKAEYSIKFAQPLSRISFRVAARFGAKDGTGERLGSRACKFNFTRH